MPDIRPFRGIRYDLARVGALSDVVAPPYDVIDPGCKTSSTTPARTTSSASNSTARSPATRPEHNRYTRAARFLNDWPARASSAGPAPAFYVYQQTFDVEGQTYTRRGFLARVRLEPFGQGRDLPHEQTLSGPKADRLTLFHATGFNLSPIFGLYPDDDGRGPRAVEAASATGRPLEATDHLGVVNRLWPVTTRRSTRAVQGLMGAEAGLHRRRPPPLRDRPEISARSSRRGRARRPDDPANFCMMMLVGMSDPGLLILPTHRLVSGLPGLTADELAAPPRPRVRRRRQTGTGDAGGPAAWEDIEAGGDQDVLGFGTVADGRWLTARLRSDADDGRPRPRHSRRLAVAGREHPPRAGPQEPARPARHRHLPLRPPARRGPRRTSPPKAATSPASSRPPGMEHVEAIASNLEKMPPKSTYFYPKLLSGLVLNPLR